MTRHGDPADPLAVQNVDGSPISGGGGGGGGAVTVADGADVTQGAKADVEVASAGSASVVAVLKRLRTLLNGGLPAALDADGGLKTHLQNLSTLATDTVLQAVRDRIGEVQASPTSNTVLDRLKTIATALAGTLTVSQAAQSGAAAQPGTAVTVGASSSTLVSANAARRVLYVGNDHATQVLYLRLGASAAVANQGIRVGPGMVAVIRGDEYAGEVRAIASGAGTVATISEV